MSVHELVSMGSFLILVVIMAMMLSEMLDGRGR